MNNRIVVVEDDEIAARRAMCFGGLSLKGDVYWTEREGTLNNFFNGTSIPRF